eukprot:GHUV01045438.1.p1 GENE.GHUV01045438.1~~GHUV01045438.1.p1  ORF type:complete len:128 (-),score=16.68 GHUV01045438.1:355-738(-)
MVKGHCHPTSTGAAATSHKVLVFMSLHWVLEGRLRKELLCHVRYICHLSSPAVVAAGSRSSRLVFTSCANAAFAKDWPLVWSVMPLLTDGRALPGLLAQQLGMRSPPPLAAVIQHLQMVSIAQVFCA